jgi:hypothetical protein
MNRSFRSTVFLAVLMAILLALSLGALGCGAGGAGEKPAIEDDPHYQVLFTDPAQQLAETSKASFTAELYREALAYEPALDDPGTQVGMGFWSGPNNHGSLVRVIDTINSNTSAPQKAIWDEGATSSYQYPSYFEMLQEHWYDRAYPENGKVTVFGRQYNDAHPVTIQQADEIWGQYSARYVDMAALIKRDTGVPVQAWCFVEGAKENRVFYTYELPRLKKLEMEGAVRVYFAKTQDANVAEASDWIEGTANAPAPLPAQ